MSHNSAYLYFHCVFTNEVTFHLISLGPQLAEVSGLLTIKPHVLIRTDDDEFDQKRLLFALNIEH
jgi:hypothetical protein